MKMEKKMKKHERFMLRGLIHIDIALGGGYPFWKGEGDKIWFSDKPTGERQKTSELKREISL